MISIAPIEILGLFAGFLTAFSSVPQTVKIIKMKSAETVSAGTYFMIFGSCILWFAYGFLQNAISIIFWNVVGVISSGTVLILKLFVWNEQKE